eukprot:6733360-Pyramimonas_sp.AAC.1
MGVPRAPGAKSSVSRFGKKRPSTTSLKSDTFLALAFAFVSTTPWKSIRSPPPVLLGQSIYFIQIAVAHLGTDVE